MDLQHNLFIWIVFKSKHVFFLALGRANPIGSLRFGDDGRHRRYSTAARRGRHRLPIGYLLDSTIRLIFHSSLFTSSRVLVCRTRIALPAHDPVHVFAIDPLFDY